MRRFPRPKELAVYGQSLEVVLAEELALPVEPETAELASLITGKVTIRNTGSAYLVRGHLEFKLRLTCVRCLEPFEQAFSVDFQEQCPKRSFDQRKYESKDDAEWLALGEDLPLIIQDQVDLSDILVEYVLLSLPPYPVCDPGCKGLCPVCGARLNFETCTCQVSVPDTPFARQLKAHLHQED